MESGSHSSLKFYKRLYFRVLACNSLRVKTFGGFTGGNYSVGTTRWEPPGLGDTVWVTKIF